MQASITYKNASRNVRMCSNGTPLVYVNDIGEVSVGAVHVAGDGEEYYDPEGFAFGSINLWLSKTDAVRMAHSILAEVTVSNQQRLNLIEESE